MLSLLMLLNHFKCFHFSLSISISLSFSFFLFLFSLLFSLLLSFSQSLGTQLRQLLRSVNILSYISSMCIHNLLVQRKHVYCESFVSILKWKICWEDKALSSSIVRALCCKLSIGELRSVYSVFGWIGHVKRLIHTNWQPTATTMMMMTTTNDGDNN